MNNQQRRHLPYHVSPPQLDTVLQHLRRTGTITQREAIMDHSVQSLTKQIANLRDMGFNIITNNKRHPITNQRYASYELRHG